MATILFLAGILCILLLFVVGGTILNRGFGSYVSGVSQAWGRPHEQTDGDEAAPGHRGRQERSRGWYGATRWRGYPIAARFLRILALLAILAAELYAGENFFGSIWIGVIAGIATVLIALAAI